MFPTERGPETRSKYTWKQKSILVMLVIADLISYTSVALMAPFYPREAENRGMSETLTGAVFSSFPIVSFLASPVVGKFLPNVGVKSCFIGGLLLSGLSIIAFGGLNFIVDLTLFTVFSFLIRGLVALGCVLYFSCSYVLVAKIFSKHIGIVRGILGTSTGLGFCIAPSLGTYLYTAGDFGLPFYVMGAISLFLTPFGILLLPPNEKSSNEQNNESFTTILKIPSVAILCLITVIIGWNFYCLEPILEPHLRTFNLSIEVVGNSFLVTAIVYGIFCPICGWISNRINSWYLLPAALFVGSFSFFLLGPSTLFLPSSFGLNLVGLALVGLSLALGASPSFQAILELVLRKDFENSLGINCIVTGLWTSSFLLGQSLGPFASGVLYQHYGFQITLSFFSLLNFVVALVGILDFCFSQTLKH